MIFLCSKYRALTVQSIVARKKAVLNSISFNPGKIFNAVIKLSQNLLHAGDIIAMKRKDDIFDKKKRWELLNH